MSGAGSKRSATELYARALATPADHRRSPYRLRCDDGSLIGLPVARWLGCATGADERLLARASGPVLDVGCGPGRHVHALARRGVLALGVDISPVAVSLARQRGAPVLEGSIFGHIPGARTWASALLLDGNIGIAGAPARLLSRIAALLSEHATIFVEVEPPGTTDRTAGARLEGARLRSEWFSWARVSVEGIQTLAPALGMAVVECWQDDERWFARLSAPACTRRAARSSQAHRVGDR